MNRLLKRQLRRHVGGIENVPENMKAFLEAVERSYNHYEDDRLLLERSMDISSEELELSNQKLKADSVRQQEILSKLKNSLKTLFSLQAGNGGLKIEDDDDILGIIDLIEKQTKRIIEVESELMLVNNLIDHSTDSVQVVDEDGNFIFVNQEASRRFNMPKKDIMNAKVQEFSGIFKNNPGRWEKYKSEVKEKDHVVITGEIYNENGGRMPVEVSTRFIEHENKGYILAFSRDITERKKAEEKMKEAVENLKTVNTELENFAYVVSHDLKAPLRGIGSLTDWMIQDHSKNLDGNGKEMLQLMKQRVHRLHNLIEGILQYSKVGRTGVVKKEISIKKIIEEIIDSVEVKEGMNIEYSEDLPTILNDETTMRQVFQNLISNGIKYNNNKEGIIKISYSDEESHWQFCVEDNGEGIDKKYHDRIFKIFQTLTTEDSMNSTGIGLTIVKKIIETNQGEIWVDSDIGKGTRFFFTLKK